MPKLKRNPDEYIVQDIFPRREVHLVAGPSGSGKSTWLLEMAMNWRKGIKIFGHESFPQEYVYVSCDRSEPGVIRTLERMGINPNDINYLGGIENNIVTLEGMLGLVASKFPKARVLFVEGIATLIGGNQGAGNDYKSVAVFLRRLTKLCQEKDITVIGVVHTAKAKENERYLSPRERIMGSGAWASYSETVIAFEPVEADNPDCQLRKLYLLPRNAREQLFELEMRDGLLVPAPKKKTVEEKFDEYLQALKPGQYFETEDLLDYSHAFASKRTCYRWLKEMEKFREIRKIKAGTFQKREKTQEEKQAEKKFELGRIEDELTPVFEDVDNVDIE